MKNTPNYNLPQYEGTDKFTKEVLNDAFSKIDLAIDDLQETFNTTATGNAITIQEVINARNGKENLKERIDEIDVKVDTNAEQLETIENKTINYITLEDFGGVADANYLKDGKWYKDSGFTTLATDNTSALEQALELVYENRSTIQLYGHYHIGKCEKILINKSSIQIQGLGINNTSLKFTHQLGGLKLKKESGNGYIYEIFLKNFYLDGCNNTKVGIEGYNTEQCFLENISFGNFTENAMSLSGGNMFYVNRLTLLDNKNGIKLNGSGYIDINQANIWNCENNAFEFVGGNSQVIIHNSWIEQYDNVLYSYDGSNSCISMDNVYCLDGRNKPTNYLYSQETETNEKLIQLELTLENCRIRDNGLQYLFNIPSSKTNHSTIYKIKINNLGVIANGLQKVVKHTTPFKNIKMTINTVDLPMVKILDDSISISGNLNYYGNNVFINGFYGTDDVNTHFKYDVYSRRFVVRSKDDTAYYQLSVDRGGLKSERPSEPVLGETYYDTTLLKLIVFDGGIWRDMQGNSAM